MCKWIKTSDKLPEVRMPVLVWSTLDNDYALAYLDDDAENWHCQCFFGVDYFTRSGISHWQPLPEKIGELINAD